MYIILFCCTVANAIYLVTVAMLYYMIGKRSNRRKIQVEPPSVTKHIARTLERYPDGGQILKVSVMIFS